MCDELGGFEEFTSSIVSPQTFLALLAVFFAAIQGVVALESVDPCRMSRRKMNILLVVEAAEFSVSIAAEILSFVELRNALKFRLTWLQWIAPCLLAAGVIETAVDLYFTLAVVSKNRIGWIPFSVIGANSSKWEVFPFILTFVLSLILVGWRLRWWWPGCVVDSTIAITAAEAETALKPGVMGYAVGWAVGISALVFLILLLSDFSEDGVHYIAGIRYLWSPDKWVGEQYAGVKVWYREGREQVSVQQYIATATLDANVETASTGLEIEKMLEHKPLHCGNAIVGQDVDLCHKEDAAPSRLHKIILLAEHVVALPLLIVAVVIVSRLHDSLDEETFDALQQLADSVIILAFLEVSIGIKNVLWSVSGTSQSERVQASSNARLEELNATAQEYRPTVFTKPRPFLSAGPEADLPA